MKTFVMTYEKKIKTIRILNIYNGLIAILNFAIGIKSFFIISLIAFFVGIAFEYNDTKK